MQINAIQISRNRQGEKISKVEILGNKHRVNEVSIVANTRKARVHSVYFKCRIKGKENYVGKITLNAVGNPESKQGVSLMGCLRISTACCPRTTTKRT